MVATGRHAGVTPTLPLHWSQSGALSGGAEKAERPPAVLPPPATSGGLAPSSSSSSALRRAPSSDSPLEDIFAQAQGLLTQGLQLQPHMQGFSEPLPLHLALPPAALLPPEALTEPPAREARLVGLAGRCQPYVKQVITHSLNAAALRLLGMLRALQLQDGVLAPWRGPGAGKRYLCSMKESIRAMPAAQLLLVAPDITGSPATAARPVQLLHFMLQAAGQHSMPVVFCLSRSSIGQVFGRDKQVSAVAVLRTDGCEAELLELLGHASQGVALYNVQFHWPHCAR